MRKVISAVAVLIGICSISALHAAEPAMPKLMDIQTRTGHYYISYIINDDGTSVESREWSATVLKPAAIDWLKQTSISYSTSVQKAEIIAAYTKKSDGRRLDVPKDNYQININKGNGKNGPVFSDRTSMSVVFPDVAVGDTVFFSYRIAQTEPIFPKHFSLTEVFSKQGALDNARLRIEYPESLWVQYQSRDMNETLSTPIAGRKLVEWTYSNPNPVKSNRTDYSVFDPDKTSGVSFSTFRTYADIAAAYGARAIPKAAVTESITKLANEIVGDKKNPKDQARALYEWVSTTITYAGNCVGIGSVVPHDLSFVLENKMGDCKDHATLLQALLAAKGIQSTQVLINADSIYNLPKIPVISNINHVLNYLPAFDLYVDSTSGTTPFGSLPHQDRGKPVLFVENYKDGTQTPTPKMASEQKTISKLSLADDGSLSGTVEVFLKGDAASGTREWARKQTLDAQEDFVKNALRSLGINGHGTIEKDDPTALTDIYHYKITIAKAEKFLKSSGSGAFFLYPWLSGGAIQNLVQTTDEETIPEESACTSGALTEQYTIVLPKRLKVLSIPNKIKVTNKLQSYEASYSLKNNTLTANRVFEDRTPTSVCSAATISEFNKFNEKVADNLKEQVLYK